MYITRSFLLLVAAVPHVTAKLPAQAASGADGEAPTWVQRLLGSDGLQRASFTAEWLWFQDNTSGATRVRSAPSEPATARGSFAPGMLRVQVDKGVRTPAIELVQAGRFAIARTDADWRMVAHGTGVAADGGFVPDPVRLLRALTIASPTVADRSIGEADGVAVEWIAMPLTGEQVAVLVDAGAIPDPQPMGASMRAMAARGHIDASKLPAPIVDVALELDVATRNVRRMRLRSLVEPFDWARLRGRVQPGAGGEAGRRPEPDGAADERADDEAAPMSFEAGMPVREVGELQQCWLELRFTDHGAGPGVVLDEQQRRLLGR